MKGVNQRKHTRFRVPVAVEVTWSGGSFVGVTDDLGLGGCRLAAAQVPPRDALVKVRLWGEGLAGVAGKARVAWTADGAAGLAFAPALVEAMPPLLRALVGEGAPKGDRPDP